MSARFCMLWLALAGCSESEATPEPEPAPEIAPEVVEEEVEIPDDEVDEDEEPLDLEAMDERELEAACFQGRTAACDQLGH